MPPRRRSLTREERALWERVVATTATPLQGGGAGLGVARYHGLEGLGAGLGRRGHQRYGRICGFGLVEHFCEDVLALVPAVGRSPAVVDD